MKIRISKKTILILFFIFILVLFSVGAYYFWDKNYRTTFEVKNSLSEELSQYTGEDVEITEGPGSLNYPVLGYFSAGKSEENFLSSEGSTSTVKFIYGRITGLYIYDVEKSDDNVVIKAMTVYEGEQKEVLLTIPSDKINFITFRYASPQYLEEIVSDIFVSSENADSLIGKSVYLSFYYLSSDPENKAIRLKEVCDGSLELSDVSLLEGLLCNSINNQKSYKFSLKDEELGVENFITMDGDSIVINSDDILIYFIGDVVD